MEFNKQPVNAARMFDMRRAGPVDGLAAMRAREEQARKDRERAVLLFGLLAGAGGMQNSEVGMENGQAAPAGNGKPSSPAAAPVAALKALLPGGEKPGILPAVKKALKGGGQAAPGGDRRGGGASIAEGGGAFGGGAPMRDTGMSNESAAKVFPIAMMGGGVGAAASGGGGFLSSPVGGAAAAAGIDLVGGLLGGGGDDAEEVAKDQLRAQRQMNLFDGFRQWNDRLARRNEEMRAVLASLGN